MLLGAAWTAMVVLTLPPDASADPPTALPGVWRELESGQGHDRVQTMRQASGGKLLCNFNPGSRSTVTFQLSEPMAAARLYLRYNNAMKDLGRVAATLTAEGAQPRALGELAQTASARWDELRWTSLPVGPLAAGTYSITFQCPKDKASGGLDVAVLIDDRWDGLYQPPVLFAQGKPVGTGEVLPPIDVQPRALASNGEYLPSTPIDFEYVLKNRTASPRQERMLYQVEDHDAKVLATGQLSVDLNGEEEVTRRVTLSPSLPAGWYIAKLLYANGATSVGYFTVLPESTIPAGTPPPRPAAWLGMNLGYANADELNRVVLPDFKNVGLQAIRTGGNKANPADHEADVDAMRGAGLEIHWIINYRGAGINPKGTAVSELSALDLNGPVMKTWFDNYKARCKALMQYYSAPGKERIRYYVCGNEPDKKDLNTGLPGRPDVAVRLNRAMAEAAMEINPDGIIVESSAVAAPDAEYLHQMLKMGLAHHCHVVGTHVYGSQTVDYRLNKPWEWLKEVHQSRPVACSESGVTTGWTPKGVNGRDWQSDYMAQWFVKSHCLGYEYGILFTHDHDHTPDWAQMRTKEGILQPNWDLIKDLTQPRGLVNGDFEAPNDPRRLWTPDRNIDHPTWLDEQFVWQSDEKPHGGKFSVRFNQGQWRNLPVKQFADTHPTAYQVVSRGIIPGRPVTVHGFIRTTGKKAWLTLNGYDRMHGEAIAGSGTITAAEWTAVEVTATPTNPWIVIGLHAEVGDQDTDFTWFDDITVD